MILSEFEKKEIEYSHLNLDLSKIDFFKLRNPFDNYKSTDDYMQILKAIRDPKNFYFTCQHIFNVDPILFQLVWLELLWEYPFPMVIANRGASKTFTSALYCLMRALITQGCKIVIASATFRQAKYVFEYCENIWNNAPVLRDICGDTSKQGPSRGTDTWTFRVGSSTITAIPLGSGEKIRGLRAQYVLIEEFNCLAANTLCETNKGLVRIEDAVKDLDIQLINQNGEYETPIRRIKTQPTDVYEIMMERGFSFKCSSIHKVLTWDGFKLAKDLTDKDCIISENKYRFPDQIIDSNGLKVDDDLAWLMGILLAEGCVNDKHSIHVNMIDKNCIDRIEKSFLTIDPNFHITRATKEAYQDERFKGICQKSYQAILCNLNFRNRLVGLGLDRTTAHDKKIPWSILQSPRKEVISFLAGLLEGDGSAFLWSYKTPKKRLGLSFYSVSKQLAQEVQILLKKLGYLSYLTSRNNHLSDNLQYMVRLNGSYALSLAKELNIEKWKSIIDNCDEKTLDHKKKITYNKKQDRYYFSYRENGKNKRGSSNSYEKALRLFEERSIEHLKVKSIKILPEKEILYDFELPNIHSFYGNGMVQHNSVNPEIFEIVLRGFTATSSNPQDNVKNFSKIEKMKEKGLWTPEQERKVFYKPNQIILSGTAGFEFQHFAKYWKRYHDIITSKGDPKKLQQVLGVTPGKGFSHKDYCIIRMPHESLPRGIMEDKAVENSRATMDKGRFDCEFNAVFSKDSAGFFRRSIIESCTTKIPIQLPSGLVQFHPRLTGDPSARYVMGVDPASESDNFAIYIVEVCPDHVRCVYCWTINRQKAFQQFKEKKAAENTFYAYITRKIRSLMKVFQIEFIGLDSGGGGIAVLESLRDNRNLESGDLPIHPIRQDDGMMYPGMKDYGYDDEPGLHMIDMINFSKAEWVVDANHGLRKALENRVLLFPNFDGLSFTLAEMEDESSGREVDTLEDVVYEIEQSKEELSCIVHSTTLTGRDKFETPDVILQGGKKAKMRKDRYSALLIAYSIARRLLSPAKTQYVGSPGGFISDYAQKDVSGKLYTGADWYSSSANKSAFFGTGVNPERKTDRQKNQFNNLPWNSYY